MSCARGKASPDSGTKLRLFADSGGYCQNPKCSRMLFLDVPDTQLHIAEIAHVFSASDVGPRSNQRLSKEERGEYGNLILLCPTCHTTIDKSEEHYPDSLLREWKESHRQRISNLFTAVEYREREEVRAAIEPILHENKTIFETYGPLTDERFNPESDMPAIWKRKILTKILPNNRKLLQIIETNRKHLSETELQVFNTFQQHADDFERKHVGESASSGLRFPSQFSEILSP